MPAPTLDSLPLELLIQIVRHAPDLQSLRSIALCSNSCYAAYLVAREDALRNILIKQYDGLVDTNEAIAAVRSKQLHASRPSDRYKIIALLDGRRRTNELRRLQTQIKTKEPLPDEPADSRETFDLLKLHESAEWLLNEYGRNAPCPFWIDYTKWKTQVLPLELSDIEKRRWYRAFYRLQTFGNLFGPGENPLDSEHSGGRTDWEKGFERKEVWRLFFGCLAPWEYEEVKCFWKYLHDANKGLYTEISEDLEGYGYEIACLPDSLKATILPSCSLLETDDLRRNDMQMRESFASLGPDFLVRLLRADFVTRRNMVYANALIGHSYIPWGMSAAYSDKYPLIYPADRFNFDMDWEGMKAFILTLPEIERPNLGWQRTWYESVDDPEPPLMVFEDMLDTDTVWVRRLQWQYALWDTERLTKWETEYGAPLRDFDH